MWPIWPLRSLQDWEGLPLSFISDIKKTVSTPSEGTNQSRVPAIILLPAPKFFSCFTFIAHVLQTYSVYPSVNLYIIKLLTIGIQLFLLNRILKKKNDCLLVILDKLRSLVIF